jgi:hypothetical protein
VVRHTELFHAPTCAAALAAPTERSKTAQKFSLLGSAFS